MSKTTTILVCKNGKVHFDMVCNCDKPKKKRDTIKYVLPDSILQKPPGDYKVYVSQVIKNSVILEEVRDE